MPTEVFAPIINDTIFKIAFTTEKNKGSLLFLLNTCLKEVLKDPITDVTIIQTVEPSENKGGRVTVFDMQCKSADGTRFIVEMQVGKQRYFVKRTFFCLCRAISNLVGKGKKKVGGSKVPYDYNIPVIYTLSFLDFEMDFGKGCDEIIQHLSVFNSHHQEVRYDLMHMVYVILPRFGKDNWDDCQSAFDELVFTFKNGHKLLEKPKTFRDKALGEIYESAKISNLSAEELMEYERSKKHLSDYAAALEYASEEGMERGMEKGMAKGIAIGKEEGIAIGKEEGIAIGEVRGKARGKKEGITIGEIRGKAENALLNARRMKAKGFNTAVICEITGLSESEVDALRPERG